MSDLFCDVESGMFQNLKEQANVQRGNFFMFFTNSKRFKKYFLAILIGLPTWYVIGILVNYSNRFAKEFYGDNHIESGKAIMYAYAAIAIGDILVGLLSQYFKSRKKALLSFYILCIAGLFLFFSQYNNSDARMYAICAFLGFSTGFWAIFVTMGAEQFGTNLRASAAVSIPNIVRAGVVPLTFAFRSISPTLSPVLTVAVLSTACVAIAMIALWSLQETFGKDLDYLEE